jgi:hypothetical protein
MRWAVLDFSAAPKRVLTSDLPVEMFNLKGSNGVLSLPISPTRVFVAVNEDATLLKLQRAQPRDLVCYINTYVVSRARRFVWAQDTSQERFISNKMSTKLEPTPLLPNIGRYEPTRAGSKGQPAAL